jgi:hypothetical protein
VFIPEESAEQVVGASRVAVFQELRDEILRQQINVFGEQRDEHLQDSAATSRRCRAL